VFQTSFTATKQYYHSEDDGRNDRNEKDFEINAPIGRVAKAHDSNILTVNAVVDTPFSVGTLANVSFGPLAPHVVQPNRTCPQTIVVSTLLPSDVSESQRVADDLAAAESK